MMMQRSNSLRYRQGQGSPALAAALCRALLAITLVVAGATGLVACDKGSAAGSASVRKMAAQLPGSSAVVGGASLEKLRQSPLFNKLKDKLLADLPAELAEVKTVCGIDVVNDIDTIIVGIGEDLSDQSKQLVALQGKFDEDKVGKCLTAMAKKKDGEDITIEKDGKISIYKSSKGTSLHVYWPDSRTAMFIPDRMKELDPLKRILEGDRLPRNTEIKEVLDKVDSGATLWTAGLIPPGAGEALGPFKTMTPKKVYFTINVASDITAKAVLLFEKEDQASGLAAMAQMGINQARSRPDMQEFADVFSGVTFKPSGKELVIEAKLTTAQVERAIEKSMKR